MKQVEELIKSEFSAIKSIDSVLGKIHDSKEMDRLYEIRNDHFHAINKLKSCVKVDIKENPLSVGPWGAFEIAFSGGASFFGDKVALRALKVGEEHGLKEYKKIMQDKGISSELKELIQKDLMPVQEKHLEIINKFLQ